MHKVNNRAFKSEQNLSQKDVLFHLGMYVYCMPVFRLPNLRNLGLRVGDQYIGEYAIGHRHRKRRCTRSKHSKIPTSRQLELSQVLKGKSFKLLNLKIFLKRIKVGKASIARCHEKLSSLAKVMECM